MDTNFLRNHFSVSGLSDSTLFELNVGLATKLNGDCIFINSDMYPRLDEKLMYLVDNLVQTRSELADIDHEHLIVMLETIGGSIHTVERLVGIMRENFKKVSFVIPNYAYSAGTVLALSGDNIYMNYFSVLGPIDPQIQLASGKSYSEQGLLSKYKEVVAIINSTEDFDSVRAEISVLTKNFEQAELFQIEQAILHGISLVTDWLVKYKFKNWLMTETRQVTVTQEMREQRARSIVAKLGNAEMWHSHGRGITRERLGMDDIKLVIDDFGKDRELKEKISQYHNLAVSFFENMRMQNAIHSRLGTLEI